MNTVSPSPFLQALHQGAEQLWLQAQPQWPRLRVMVLPETDSTNTQLMQAARQGQRDTVVMTTAHQTAGRGRMGRQWQDQPGQALMFSVGMPLENPDPSGLSLAIGVALAEALGAPVQLKWPNDLWVHHAGQWCKLGGILTEVAHDGQLAHVVVGVGINLLTPNRIADTSVPPIGLDALNKPHDAAQALPKLALAVLQALTQFMANGFGPWAARFDALDALKGHIVQVSDGRQGVAMGVARDGALQLDIAGHVQAIHSQEVSVRPC